MRRMIISVSVPFFLRKYCQFEGNNSCFICLIKSSPMENKILYKCDRSKINKISICSRLFGKIKGQSQNITVISVIV